MSDGTVPKTPNTSSEKVISEVAIIVSEDGD